MLSDEYLIHGLNALSRAHRFDYFADGHRGGAILSGVWLTRHPQAEPGVAPRIAAQIDAQWVSTPLCEPMSVEDADPSLLEVLLDSIVTHAPGMRQAGHNIILPALALKALAEQPEALTPSRVAGMVAMIEAFRVTDVPDSRPVDVPDPADRAAFAEFALAEFVDCAGRFEGRGQGWSGHLLTYSQAMLDLADLGYRPVVEAAMDGYETYVRRIRLGPQETDVPRSEHPRLSDTPLQASYWERRTGDWNLGHVLKYPYGYFGLREVAGDPALIDHCDAVAFRVL